MKKGSVTVEAAIALPVFLCVVLSIVFLIKIVYTHELIAHAISETADEIASAGYIYHISGIQDVHDSVRNGLQDRADVFREHIGTVFDAGNSLNNLAGSLDSQGSIKESTDLLNDAKSSFNNMVEAGSDAASNPADELKNIACFLASGAFDDLKTELFTPVVRMYMKKYLITDGISDADIRLKALNVRGGMSGLDFSDSNFLADENEDIDIVVKYSIDFPLPIRFLPDAVFVQRACVKAWMGGDESSGVIDNESTDDIWSLDNFKRGSKIRTVFGANLPSTFPVIARFDAGKAVMIKSMDLTAEGYQNSSTVSDTLDGYLKELIKFSGQDKPWGSKKIIIKESDIRQKELVLVIPQNQLSPQVEQILSSHISKAAAQGVKLTVERYGLKKINP